MVTVPSKLAVLHLYVNYFENTGRKDLNFQVTTPQLSDKALLSSVGRFTSSNGFRLGSFMYRILYLEVRFKVRSVVCRFRVRFRVRFRLWLKDKFRVRFRFRFRVCLMVGFNVRFRMRFRVKCRG